MALKSKVSPVLFVVTVLCFLLPFVTVSCNGQKVDKGQFTGLQLATGTTVEQPQMFGRPQKEKVEAQPLATAALVCALAGLGLSFLGIRLAIAPAGAGGLGAVLLLLLQSQLSNDIARRSQGMFQLEYESGFWLTLAFFVLATAWNGYVSLSLRKAPATATSPPIAAAAAVGIGATFCPHCGQKLGADSRFCGACGKPVS